MSDTKAVPKMTQGNLDAMLAAKMSMGKHLHSEYLRPFQDAEFVISSLVSGEQDTYDTRTEVPLRVTPKLIEYLLDNDGEFFCNGVYFSWDEEANSINGWKEPVGEGDLPVTPSFSDDSSEAAPAILEWLRARWLSPSEGSAER
jgi:hypothetical protein